MLVISAENLGQTYLNLICEQNRGRAAGHLKTSPRPTTWWATALLSHLYLILSHFYLILHPYKKKATGGQLKTSTTAWGGHLFYPGWFRIFAVYSIRLWAFSPKGGQLKTSPVASRLIYFAPNNFRLFPLLPRTGFEVRSL